MGRAGRGQLPVGVSVVDGHLQIAFSYQGVQCRERLRLEPTPANIKYAERLRAEIYSRIERQTFVYFEYFPKSKRARLFGGGGLDAAPTVGALLDSVLADAERALSPSTHEGYSKAIEAHLRPAFGLVRVDQLTPAAIRAWIRELKVSPKRVRNLLTPLRSALALAVNDEHIEVSPLDRVKVAALLARHDTTTRADDVDPFTLAELEALVRASAEGVERNLVRWWPWCGVRTSEMLALEWGDVDLLQGVVQIQRALVAGKIKGPKTRAGSRAVVLLPEARAALEAQRAHTRLAGVRVWVDPRSGRPWETDQQTRRWWESLCRRAGVRYRYPYQCRHTYASQLLTQGFPELWVAGQLGHRDVSMIRRRYGRWINNSGGVVPADIAARIEGLAREK